MPAFRSGLESEDYLKAFFSKYQLKDSTDHSLHTYLLREEYGILSSWHIDGTLQSLAEALKKGPVTTGMVHLGSDQSPRGSHINMIRGMELDGSIYYATDPYGSINNGYSGPVNEGRSVPITRTRMKARWYAPPGHAVGGYYRKFLGLK